MLVVVVFSVFSSLYSVSAFGGYRYTGQVMYREHVRCDACDVLRVLPQEPRNVNVVYIQKEVQARQSERVYRTLPSFRQPERVFLQIDAGCAR